MTRKTFSLGDHFEGFVKSQVDAGRFDNESEVVRAGLRLLEDYEAKMSALRADIALGDADVAAGRTIAVDDPSAFADDIVRRGQERSNQKNS